jgi:hypothetical protein
MSHDGLKGPKPWMLTEEETFASYSKWQANIVYNLHKDAEFAPFLREGATWLPQRPDSPYRGFRGHSKEVQAANLNMMLTRLAQWVPHYLSNDIISESTSMPYIWNTIRSYYGFQQSEVQFMAFSQITWEGPNKERPERLYRRILSHLHDNLLKRDCKLKHNDKTQSVDEAISPTVERLAVLRWMELIHPRLTQLVARTFAYDLQRMTLKDIQPQIAHGLPGFLEELQREDVQASSSQVSYSLPVEEPVHAARAFSAYPPRRQSRPQTRYQPRAPPQSRPRKQCRICKAEGRSFWGHDMGSCQYLGRAEKTDIIRSVSMDPDLQECIDEVADLELQSPDNTE